MTITHDPSLNHLLERLDMQHQMLRHSLPAKYDAHHFIDGMFDFLFPINCQHPRRSSVQFVDFSDQLMRLLQPLVEDPESVTDDFFHTLPELYDALQADIQATLDFDPAATSREEVITTYPGFHAIAIHRMAHRLHQLGTPLLPRLLTEYAHGKTGIDIHPAARIWRWRRRLC